MTKNEISKICLCLLVFAILVISLNINVYAAEEYTCKLELVPAEAEILAGETVIIDIMVSDIQAGNGIAVVDGLVEYDKTVFEETFEIERDDEKNWNPDDPLENYVMFITSNREATIEDGVIGKIVLKAKQEVELGETEIRLTNISVSADDNQKFQLENVAAKVEVVEEKWIDEEPGDDDLNGEPGEEPGDDDLDEKPGDNNQNNGEKPSGDNQGNNNQNGNNTQTPGKPVDTGKAETTLPKTGNANFLVIGIIGAVILVSIFYVKYSRAY